MPFTARCPTCNVKMRFPTEAAGSSAECPKCHNFFTVAPPDEVALPERFQRLAQMPKAVVAVADAPATETAPGPTAPVLPSESPSRPVNLCGVVAFLCGSIGLLTASIAVLHSLT